MADRRSNITGAQFAFRAAAIASLAAKWASDAIFLPEDVTEPMRAEPIERFLDEVRDRLTGIEVAAAKSDS